MRKRSVYYTVLLIICIFLTLLSVGPASSASSAVTIETIDDYTWLNTTSGGSPSISSLSWGGPVRPLLPITMFGKQVDKFQIGKFGQLKFLTYSNGKFKYSDKDCELPESINKLSEGYQILGFGEPVKIKGCGVSVTHGIEGSNYVITFSVIHKYSGDRQKWQYVFPLRHHNKVIIILKSVRTSVNTIIGAIGAPGTGVQWGNLVNYEYHNKALLVDTYAVAAPEPTPEPTPEPIVTDWKDIFVWQDDVNSYQYRLQRSIK